jgi:hypothetical protein
MRPPQVVRIGTKKTSFANFTEICKTWVNDILNLKNPWFISCMCKTSSQMLIWV